MGQFGEESQGLKIIKVNKNELVESIVKNLAQHKIEFTEAMAGFMVKAEQKLKVQLKAVKAGTVPEPVVFQVPEDHTEDYINIIDLLGMSVDEELEITYEQFKRYVKDDWNWSHGFKSMHTMYNN